MFLQVENSDGVAWLTLDRPDKRNALSTALRDEISDALDAAANDDSIRCVVLTGAGDIFCAGFDLREFDGLEGAEPQPERCLGAVGMRHVCVDEAVSVVRPPAEPSAVAGECEHGSACSVLYPPPLRLGEASEQAHHEVVRLAVRIHPSAHLGDPEVDAEVAQDREHELKLRTGERPLRLADDKSGP